MASCLPIAGPAAKSKRVALPLLRPSRRVTPIGVRALPLDEQERWRLAAPSAQWGSHWVLAMLPPDRCGERILRSRGLLHKARPALACIIGARRAWTVEMISSEEIPCR
jgi:hypothetical protein